MVLLTAAARRHPHMVSLYQYIICMERRRLKRKHRLTLVRTSLLAVVAVYRRRKEACCPVQAPAEASRPALAGRAYQPPRRRERGVDGGLLEVVWRHGCGHHPRQVRQQLGAYYYCMFLCITGTDRSLNTGALVLFRGLRRNDAIRIRARWHG